MNDMEHTPEQYQRVARFLDGEAVELDAAERRLAEEIAGDLRAVGEAIGPAENPAAVALARRKLAGALPPSPGRRGRVIRPWAYLAVGATAAAAVLVAALAAWSNRNPGPQPGPGPIAQAENLPELTVEEWVQVTAEAADEPADVGLLEEELYALEAELLDRGSIGGVSGELDRLEDQVEEFWLEDGADGSGDPFGGLDGGA